jgi:hypothetical protein
MNPRPLVINAEILADIKRVVDYAEAHRYSIHDVFKMMGGRDSMPPPGDDPGHVCNIPVEFRCVFSIEQQPMGWCRHLSVSVSGDGNNPNPVPVFVIAEAFGFGKEPWKSSHVSTEKIPGNRLAINVIQLLEAKSQETNA